MESPYLSPGWSKISSTHHLSPSSRLGMAAVAGACGGFVGTPGDMTNVRWLQDKDKDKNKDKVKDEDTPGNMTNDQC